MNFDRDQLLEQGSAHVPDADRCVTATLAQPGNALVLLGTTGAEFAGSHLDLVLGEPDDARIRTLRSFEWWWIERRRRRTSCSGR